MNIKNNVDPNQKEEEKSEAVVAMEANPQEVHTLEEAWAGAIS